MQLAESRAEIALDPPVLQRMPIAPDRALQVIVRDM
jgi:hypothetical protein